MSSRRLWARNGWPVRAKWTGSSTRPARCPRSEYCVGSESYIKLIVYSPAKPSRPSRAYIHVVSGDYIAHLSDKVRQASFIDAQNTTTDPVLLGPPTVEFAPYAKIPGNRVRKDARQGTIDQDPDFIAFLESLTQPISKPGPVETTIDGEEKKDSAAMTPLVQYIKDKKANKAKEQAAAKSAKHARADKEAKADKAQGKKVLQRPDREATQVPATEKGKNAKADKATKEAVKAANRQAASVVAKPSGKGSTTPNAGEVVPTAPAAERKKDRGNTAAAAKILQRDLRLSSSGGRRKGGKGAPESDGAKESAASPTEPKKDAPTKPGKGGAAKDKGNENTQPSNNGPGPQTETAPPSPAPSKPPKLSKGKQAASPSPTATQAFLKHSNPSQGVTEPLLETAFSPFGSVVKVEIDKKKGFGYVDFAEPSGLQEAIAASPVTVAQSQVVVLERKLNPGAEKSRGNKGRGEQPPAGSSAGGSNSGNSRGGKEGGRGPRGGRGSRNKGKGVEAKQ